MTYSNARTLAYFDDWPNGRHRVKCRFDVEFDGKKGERVARATTNKYGQWNKPKRTTYANRCAIVDGDDGKTYVLQESRNFRQICVMQSNLQYCEETIHESSDPERYSDLVDLLDERTDI